MAFLALGAPEGPLDREEALMGRFVEGDAPQADAAVADALVGIGREIGDLRVPRLSGVVLGGGYGRGEGGVAVGPDGAQRLSNDLDFFVVSEEGASDADLSAIGDALAPVSKRWSAALGIDVDFTVRTPWRIRHDAERVMIQELLHGYADVAGAKGEALFRGIERRDPPAFPWTEAARLLMNRGVGLMLAKASADPAFAARNVNKCVLGAGDALLIVRRGYRWRTRERAAALGDALYSAAAEWKFRPKAEPVCGWDEARRKWLQAFDEVAAAGRAAGETRRSLYQALRWIARRRQLGPLRSFGQDCTARVLWGVAESVRGGTPLPKPLMDDWRVFN
jgi:hypothetical protein